MHPSSSSWALVVPVKSGPAAKSRLHLPTDADRAAVARALAMDTLAAATDAVDAVAVVTADPSIAGSRSVLVVADPGDGLNAAIGHGIEVARGAWQDRAVGVLLADLPTLTPEDLRSALAQASRHRRAVVPDLRGTGTVLLTGSPGHPPHPRFGPDSAARHVAMGHVRLDLPLPRLRADVDSEADLARAVVIGVGSATAAALAAIRGTPAASS